MAKFLDNQDIDLNGLETKLKKINKLEKTNLDKFKKIMMVLTLNIDFSQNIINLLSDTNFEIVGKDGVVNLQNLFLAERFSKEEDLFNSLMIFFKVVGNKDFEDLNLLENYEALMILRNLGFENEFKILSESILL